MSSIFRVSKQSGDLNGFVLQQNRGARQLALGSMQIHILRYAHRPSGEATAATSSCVTVGKGYTNRLASIAEQTLRVVEDDTGRIRVESRSANDYDAQISAVARCCLAAPRLARE